DRSMRTLVFGPFRAYCSRQGSPRVARARKRDAVPRVVAAEASPRLGGADLRPRSGGPRGERLMLRPLALALALVLPAAAAAETKICVVDAQAALNETAEGKSAQ